MFHKNIDFQGKIPTNSWRRVAINTWKAPNSPHIYARVIVDPSKALEMIQELNKDSEFSVTMTHFVGKVIGNILNEIPEFNSLIVGKKLMHREEANVFFHISQIDKLGKENLSGYVVRNADKKKLLDITEEIYTNSRKVKRGEDANFKRLKRRFDVIPNFVFNLCMKLITFFQYRLNLWSPIFGNPRDSFGSLMITNIGSLGIEEAFVPFATYAPLHSMCSLGAVKDIPVIRDGKVVPGKELVLCWTMDHRVFDGSLGSKIIRRIKYYFDNPELTK